MNGKRFTPKPGVVYKNRGGGSYRCLRSGGIIPSRSAIMQNVESLWTFVAIGCTMFPDGSIEWCHSYRGRFADSSADVQDLHYTLYAEALDNVGRKVKERILKQASEDPDIDTATMRRIVDAAAFTWS